jgi:hypothetical protein
VKRAAWAVLFVCLPVLAGDAPGGWLLAGSHPRDYVASLDRGTVFSGSASASLASLNEDAKGFGTLMQESSPGAYAGRRVRMTAQIRSKAVGGWSGLWLRVDGEPGKAPLAFDNMDDRPIKGDSEWRQYAIVLDVPAKARALAYGVLLNGAGQVWLDDVSFQIVDRSVPTTRQNAARRVPRGPINLDFEQ